MPLTSSELTRRRKALTNDYDRRNNGWLGANTGPTSTAFESRMISEATGAKIASARSTEGGAWTSIPLSALQDFISSTGSNPTLSDLVKATNINSMIEQGPYVNIGVVQLPGGGIACYSQTGVFLGAVDAAGNPIPEPTPSTTGYPWTAIGVSSGVWRRITYGNGRFVAVGANSLGYSDNGINWTIQSPATVLEYVSVAYGNGVFVAVAQDTGVGVKQILTSSDGATWTEYTAPDTSTPWQGITFGNGRFVAVGSTGGTNQVMTSTDGINWTGYAGTGGNWRAVAYGNGRFVAVAFSLAPAAQMMISTNNGVSWSIQSLTGVDDVRFTSITYGNGLFVAIGSTGTNRVLTSPDGITWTAVAVPVGTWQAVTAGNGIFVAVGSAGTNRVITSSDGVTWTARDPANTNPWQSVVYGTNKFVAVALTGTNRIMTAP